MLTRFKLSHASLLKQEKLTRRGFNTVKSLVKYSIKSKQDRNI
jgi:hypothetical protein